MKSSFHSNSEKACLFLERSLNNDGIKTKKESRLNNVTPFKTVGRFIHTHVLHAECDQKILETYVVYLADKFEEAFLNFSITEFTPSSVKV